MRRQHAVETEWSVDLLRLQPTHRVLEIGFGVGRGLALALQQAIQGRVTGIDLSATMIQTAIRHNRVALAHGQLALVRGDIAHLPFGNQQFDKIFSIHTFYFWPDPGTICHHLINLLAQGGRLVSTLQLHTPSRMVNRCIGHCINAPKRCYEKFGSRRTLLRIWSTAQTHGSTTTSRS
jgi:ubiquinone/menaquinone biosynthesis C-methylase UbiE